MNYGCWVLLKSMKMGVNVGQGPLYASGASSCLYVSLFSVKIFIDPLIKPESINTSRLSSGFRSDVQWLLHVEGWDHVLVGWCVEEPNNPRRIFEAGGT